MPHQAMHFPRRGGRGRHPRGRGQHSYPRDYHRQVNMDMGLQQQHGLEPQALMGHPGNITPYYIQNPYMYGSKLILLALLIRVIFPIVLFALQIKIILIDESLTI